MVESSRVLLIQPRAPARRRFWLLVARNPLAAAGLAIILIMGLLALLAPVLPIPNPLAQTLSLRLHPPMSGHPLGTDQLGRDVLSRIVSGARISLTIGLAVVFAAGVFGTLIGLLAGYLGGVVDEALMRITDVFFAFPSLILAMAIAGALGPNLANATIAIAAVTWPVYARLVRGQVLSLRGREFVEAARSVGVPTGRLLLRHLLPNAMAPILVQASFDMGNAILSVAGLSFIGFGARPPTPEWGVMISEARQYIGTQFWLSAFPGLAIVLVVVAFNLLGDGLRDALDPQSQQL